MRILFDHGTPAPLIPFLDGHAVTKAKGVGWDRISNGALLTAAEGAGFDILLTTDKQFLYRSESDQPKDRDRRTCEFHLASCVPAR